MSRRALPSRLVLLGSPVAHSLSPRFQNAALRAAGIPLVYEALDVAPPALRDTMRALRETNAAGNVTIPHKRAAAAISDALTPAAERAAAVNTFWVEHGKLVGDNTDIHGVAAAVTSLLGEEPRDSRLALLGAGGSAAAVLCAAETWRSVSIALHGRTRERAEALQRRFASIARIVDTAAEAARGAHLVVNATSLGLRGDDAFPVPVELLDPGAAVLDLVYAPEETAWVRAARARGHRAADGLTMLIEQGALAFERWLGIQPDRAAMWSAVR